MTTKFMKKLLFLLKLLIISCFEFVHILIIHNVSAHIFLKWKELGCSIEPRAENKAIWVKMNGTDDENDNRFEKIFKILKFAEDASEDDGQNLRFRIITRMLIPNQKCGYVVGRNGATLKKIVKDFDVVALMDSGQTDPIPEGFGRLILKGIKLDGISSARLQIKYLIQIALDLNPYGPADGKRIMVLGKSAKAEERIKVPLFSAFSEEQKRQFREIQRTSKVDFIVDKEDKPSDGRFLLLKGELSHVIETKKRISKLIFDLRVNVFTFSFCLKISAIFSSRGTTSPPPPPQLQPLTTSKTATTFLSSLDEQPAAVLPTIDFVIPYPNFLGVLGPKGERIKSLRTELDVNLAFLGDNKAQYNEGRTLRISGKNEKKVYLAKLFIQREFIDKWSPNKNVNIVPVVENIDRRRRFDNSGNDWGKIEEDSNMEILVPQEVAKIMIKYGLTSYQLRRPRPDGFQIVVLKGPKESLEQANEELDLITAEYLKKNKNNGQINWKEEIEGIEGNKDKNEEGEKKLKGRERRGRRKKKEEGKENKDEEGNEEKEETKVEERNKGREEKKEEKNNNDDDDEEFEWKSTVNINEEEIIDTEEIIEDDDKTICGDFSSNERRLSSNSETEKAIQELLINSSFTSEEEEKFSKKDFEGKEEEGKKKEEEEKEKENNLIGNLTEKKNKLFKQLKLDTFLDCFLEEMVKQERYLFDYQFKFLFNLGSLDIKDREIALLRREIATKERENKQLKFKVFELRTALNVAQRIKNKRRKGEIF
ncbi:hypothetical protein Mgra_00004519 [Meloidogyne graminicola]|uniref:K Homology domain-containing protein n=1 Tax=Meloidogyne graminicola TaxID=189291 RepID=A0A8S9ZRK9_9BILA|nr:hypothetical protein Mgra_00004519 [Meloidogyne graminicola]